MDKQPRIDTQNQINRDSMENIKEEQHQQAHIESGQFLKSAVYGGSDGVINAMSVILGGVGSGSDPYHILSLSISILIADGIGMALGDYMSSKAQADYIKGEERREFYEVQNKLEEEKQEVVSVYLQNGYTKQQAGRVAELLSTNPQAFVNVMMLEQLGLVVDEDASPVINGVVTLVAFVILGFLPILPFVVTSGAHDDAGSRYYYVSIIVASFQLLLLGFSKAMLIGINKWKAALQSLFFGALAITVGYGIGVGLHVQG